MNSVLATRKALKSQTLPPQELPPRRDLEALTKSTASAGSPRFRIYKGVARPAQPHAKSLSGHSPAKWKAARATDLITASRSEEARQSRVPKSSKRVQITGKGSQLKDSTRFLCCQRPGGRASEQLDQGFQLTLGQPT